MWNNVMAKPWMRHADSKELWWILAEIYVPLKMMIITSSSARLIEVLADVEI